MWNIGPIKIHQYEKQVTLREKEVKKVNIVDVLSIQE
jgi:hypothetical protein